MNLKLSKEESLGISLQTETCSLFFQQLQLTANGSEAEDEMRKDLSSWLNILPHRVYGEKLRQTSNCTLVQMV